eukprot:2122-Heterococcus_DN1.PRE.1
MRGVHSMSISTGVPWGPGVHTMTMAPARSARSRHHVTGQALPILASSAPLQTAIVGASVAQLLCTELQFGNGRWCRGRVPRPSSEREAQCLVLVKGPASVHPASEVCPSV